MRPYVILQAGRTLQRVFCYIIDHKCAYVVSERGKFECEPGHLSPVPGLTGWTVRRLLSSLSVGFGQPPRGRRTRQPSWSRVARPYSKWAGTPQEKATNILLLPRYRQYTREYK